MITLTHGTVTVDLPDQLVWTDEHAWQPVQHDVEYSITGALLVDVGVRLAGRPITLEGSAERAWISLQVLEQLQALAAQPAIPMQLVLHGVQYAVGWDHERGAIEARPIQPWPDPLPADPYVATLRFFTLS